MANIPNTNAKNELPTSTNELIAIPYARYIDLAKLELPYLTHYSGTVATIGNAVKVFPTRIESRSGKSAWGAIAQPPKHALTTTGGNNYGNVYKSRIWGIF